MSTSTHPPRTGPPVGGSPPPTPGPTPQPGPPTDPDRRTGPIGWALALIGAGVLWLLHLAGVAIPWELVLPIGIIAIGVALLIGGRHVARSGLLGLGIVLTAIAIVVALTPMSLSFSAGDRNYTVSDVADLEPSYSLGAGTMTLDLRDLELPPGKTELSASVSMGELVVRVPEDVTVTGTGHTVAGEVVSFGRTAAGIAPRRALDELGGEDAPILELELRTGLGRIEVTR